MSKIVKAASAFLILTCFTLTLAGCGGGTEKKTEEEPSVQKSSAQDSENRQAKTVSDSTSIPEDYPKEFCPVYEPSTIVGAEKINVRDKVNYIIEFVSKDEMNTIEAFYLGLDYVTDKLRMADVISQIHLGNKSEKTFGFINLEPVGESKFASYGDEGYKIYGKITVDTGW
jgi:hypothetical protein